MIGGPDTLLTGVPASYTATATLTDGTTATVLPVWSTADPAIASVDSSGRLEGQRHGSTNIVATYEGRSASRLVHVVANYGGTWSGNYVVRDCKDSGDLTNYNRFTRFGNPDAHPHFDRTAPNATASDDDAIATFPPDSRHYRVSGFAESVRNDPSPKGKGRHHNMVAALNVGEQSVTN